MVLTLEDGTGVEDADAYIDEAFLATYVAEYVLNTTAYDAISGNAATVEKLIRSACAFLDNKYQACLRADPLTDTQGLLFPLDPFYDAQGRYVTGVPLGVKRAAAELVATMAANPTVAPQPTASTGGGATYITSESKTLGRLSTTTSYGGVGKLDTGSGTAAEGSAAGALQQVGYWMAPYVLAGNRVVRG